MYKPRPGAPLRENLLRCAPSQTPAINSSFQRLIKGVGAICRVSLAKRTLKSELRLPHMDGPPTKKAEKAI